MRKPIIAGNWKMNKTPQEAKELVEALKPLVKDAACDVVVCVPAVDIATVKAAAEGSNIKVGAQNVHFMESGAYTGELSAAMLKAAGAEYVIIGHSERRQYFGETDFTVNKRVLAAVKAGLKVIVCVGETFAYTPAFTGAETTPATSPFTGYSLDDLPCGPTSVVQTIATQGLQTIGGVPVYAMAKAEASRDRREFRFINSLGVLESISVYSLAEVVANLESVQYSRATEESFNNFARVFYKKHDGAEKLKMSSGALDRHWQQWFVHEFCVGKHVWMFVPDEKANAANNITTTVSSESNGEWLPVHITTEESISLIKRDGSEILEVAFVVEIDDEGSTDSYLRV